MMHCDHIPEDPTPLSFEQIVHLLEGNFAKYQRSKVGIVISHSAWLSSHELYLDEDTAPQGEFLHRNGIEFGPMTQENKEKIYRWGNSLGLAVEFNADNINNY